MLVMDKAHKELSAVLAKAAQDRRAFGWNFPDPDMASELEAAVLKYMATAEARIKELEDKLEEAHYEYLAAKEMQE